MKSLTRHARPRRPDGDASHGAKPYVANPKLSEALDFAEAAVIYGHEDIPADKAYRSKDSRNGLAGAAVVGALWEGRGATPPQAPIQAI